MRIQDANKKDAYCELANAVPDTATVFFDHYKDAEIFQLLTGIKSDRRLSTSKDYKWDIDSLRIFDKFPFISHEQSKLDEFKVDLIITKNDYSGMSYLQLIKSSGMYKLYQVIN